MEPYIPSHFESGAKPLIVILRDPQDFQGDVALQPRVACAIDLAHAAGTDGSDDLVCTDAGVGRLCYRVPHRSA